jgi:hypothetical protein
MRRLGITHQFRIIEPALEIRPFYLLVGQHVAQEQIVRLQAAIARIETNGSLNALRNKWF